MKNPFSVEGKNIVVIGGTRGIGRAISLCLAGAGASLVAVYIRDEKAAEGLNQEKSQKGLSIDICRADVTSRKGLGDLGRFLDDWGRKISGLVISAATGVHKSYSELSARHFDWTFGLNVRGFFECLQLFLPRFAEKASVVALSSQGAVQAIPLYSLIGASKGALESLVRHLAVELAPRGIRVNALSPGSVLTDIWKTVPDSERRLDEAVRRTPLGRLVTAEEVGFAAQFLCSDASSAITGHTLVVDGGARIVG